MTVISSIISCKRDCVIVQSYLDRLTMDVVWKSFFGMDVDVQTNPNLIYFVKLQQAQEAISSFDFFTKIMSKNLII